MICSNCGYEHNEDYCPACGKSKTTTVIDFEALEKEEKILAKNKKIAIISIVIACLFIGGMTFKAVTGSFDKPVKFTENEKIEPYGTLGEYFVDIVSATTTYDYLDQPAIIINFSYTNNSYVEESFLLAFDYKVYQDGVECNTTALDYDSSLEIDTDKYMLDVKPGVTTDIQIMYSLYNFDSNVVVEVRERNPRVYNPYDIVKKTFTAN